MTAGTRSILATLVATAAIAIALTACYVWESPRGPELQMSRAEFDVRPLHELGYSPETIKSLVMHFASGPWIETDGEGGRIDLDGDRLVLFATVGNQRDCERVLKWLESTHEVAFLEPAVARAVAALDRPVTLDLPDALLSEVLNNLGAAIGYPFRIESEGHGWLDPDQRVDVSVVDTRAWDVCRRLPFGYFPGDDHIGAVDVCMPITSSMKLQLDRAMGDTLEATLAVAGQLQEATAGPWEIIDGVGGRMRVPKPGVILVTAPFGDLMDVRDAWRRLKVARK